MRTRLLKIVISLLASITFSAGADGAGPVDVGVESSLCEASLAFPAPLTSERVREIQKVMARFVAGIAGGTYGHFIKFERVSAAGSELHVYMLYTFNGQNIHTVAVVSATTGELIQLVGPDGNKGTGVVTWFPKPKNPATGLTGE